MAESRGMARATGSMALGTLISKITGYVSKIVLVLALGGATDLANAYTLGNTIPADYFAVLNAGVLARYRVQIV